MNITNPIFQSANIREISFPIEQVVRLVDGDVIRGGRNILTHINIEVLNAQVVSILGANGSGKSSLLLAIAGELALSSGELWLFGKPVKNQLSWERSRNGVSLVPQTEYLYEDLTIEENLLVALKYTEKENWASRCANTAGIWAKYFPSVNLKTYANRLSTGEARFLSILCGLARNSPLLLIDEPSAGLSGSLCEVVFHLIRQAASKQTSVIIAEQRHDLALLISNKTYVIKSGLITEEIITNKKQKY